MRRLLILALVLCGSAYAGSGRLVLNANNRRDELPRLFRKTDDPVRLAGRLPSLEGLENLNASGSSQFSQKELVALLENLDQKYVVVVDLRQESHVFLNGMAVSWYANGNTINLGKSLRQVRSDEKKRVRDLLDKKKVFVYTSNRSAKGFEAYVKSAQREKKLVQSQNAAYWRIPVTDHRKPKDEQVDRFVELVRDLKSNRWLHFHCLHGQSRTTTFLAMYDMMRNGKSVSMRDILERQALIGGVNLYADPLKTSQTLEHARARHRFVRQFYNYCKENDDGFSTSWSDWLKEKGST